MDPQTPPWAYAFPGESEYLSEQVGGSDTRAVAAGAGTTEAETLVSSETVAVQIVDA